MVILLHCEMDDDGRRGKRQSSGLFKRVFASGKTPLTYPRPPSSVATHGTGTFVLRERRPLRSVPLVGKHHLVEPEILATSFVEKEAKYFGTVDDLPHDFNPNNRNVLLGIIDEKKRLQQFPWILGLEHDVIVNFSVHNIKLVRRDGESLLHRIPTHHIAAVGYLRDDDQHIVFIKFLSEVNNNMCKVAILCCESKLAAEELCSLSQQLFQLVYTDSTIEFFNQCINESADPKNPSDSTDESLGHIVDEPLIQPIQTGFSSATSEPSNGNIHKQRSRGVPATRSRLESSSSPHSHNTSQNTQQFHLRDYLAVLKEKLNEKELHEFALLLHEFRTHNLRVEEYCSRIFEMYTEQRKSLLLGLQPFIPKDDLEYFERFLKQHGVSELSSDDERWRHKSISEAEDSSASGIVGNSTEHSESILSSNDEGSIVEGIGTLNLSSDLAAYSSKRHLPHPEVPQQSKEADGSSSKNKKLSKSEQSEVKKKPKKKRETTATQKEQSTTSDDKTSDYEDSTLTSQSSIVTSQSSTKSQQKDHRKKKRHKKQPIDSQNV